MMLDRKNITIRMDAHLIEALRRISRQMSAAANKDVSISDIVEGALLKEYPGLKEIVKYSKHTKE